MPATPTTIQDRLSFYWQPTFDRDFPILVEVTERKSAVRSVGVRYVVQEQEPVSGGRLFLIAKHESEAGDRADEVYEVFVRPGFESCSCKGSACRGHKVDCRHRRACRFLMAEAAL